MNYRWKTLQEKIDNLSLRERRLIAITTLIIMVAFVVGVFWMPLLSQWKDTQILIGHSTTQIEQAKASITQLENRFKKDVNGPYKIKLKQLEKRVAQQERDLHELTAALIKPEHMNQVFQGLLMKNNLQVTKLKNQPAKQVQAQGFDENSQVLYEHALTLELQGGYLDALDFVQQIEGQAWQLYWSDFSFETLDFPLGKIRIKVHTLSTSNKVLGL